MLSDEKWFKKNPRCMFRLKKTNKTTMMNGRKIPFTHEITKRGLDGKIEKQQLIFLAEPPSIIPLEELVEIWAILKNTQNPLFLVPWGDE